MGIGQALANAGKLHDVVHARMIRAVGDRLQP